MNTHLWMSKFQFQSSSRYGFQRKREIFHSQRKTKGNTEGVRVSLGGWTFLLVLRDRTTGVWAGKYGVLPGLIFSVSFIGS